MYETIIFDLDGTLLDTLDDLHVAVNYALEQCALPLCTRAQVRSYVGDGVVMLMKRAAGSVSAETLESLLTAFRGYYGAHCKDETRPYEGVMELLRRLKAQGKKTAVLSNKPDFAVKLLAEEYFPNLLQSAVGENEAAGIRKKPAPDSLFAVLEELHAEKESTVYVGDSEVDIQTAQNAGVDCISVTWGFKDKEFLLKNGGKILVDTPKEILDYLGD